MSAVLDVAAHFEGIDPRLFDIPEGRRELTRLDPLAFALTYLPHHMRSEATGEQFSLAEFHTSLIEQAQEWLKPRRHMREYRDAYIAPREVGKSTWLFLILPMWAAAHGHLKFVAAFADSATQAEDHLATFRHELDANAMLQSDFPELCTPARQTRVARELAANRRQIVQKNGFIFMARGVDSAVLGMKVGAKRPDLIILDDIEPGESNYSPYQMKKRLSTLQDVILPINNFARVVLVGTVTMPNSITHQLVASVTRPAEEPAPWIAQENFDVHYFPAILVNEDGSERSIWPAKWPLEDLQRLRNTRSFRKNFMNDPLDEDGDFWSPEDIRVRELEDYGGTLLSIDPAVTSKKTSDYTGFAVVSRSVVPPERSGHHAYVRDALRARLAPAGIRQRVVRFLEMYPEITLILVETNQGGDTWKEILHNLPVKIRTIHQSESKEVRAQRVLNYYQRGRVFHCKEIPALTDELFVFPNGLTDDLVDAVTTGVSVLLKPKKKTVGSQARSLDYA